jgi:hypothetical protein
LSGFPRVCCEHEGSTCFLRLAFLAISVRRVASAALPLGTCGQTSLTGLANDCLLKTLHHLCFIPSPSCDGYGLKGWWFERISIRLL